MRTTHNLLGAIVVGGAMVLAGTVQASPPSAEHATGLLPTQIGEQQQRVHALLDKAIEHIRQNGPKAVNDFTHDPDFIDRDLYVYSLSPAGQMLSSGGWSAGLIGQNVLAETDDAGQPFFSQMLKLAKQNKAGSIEYYWFNPNDGQDEIKITYFEVVDGIVVAVGFFPGYPTEEQAKQMLEQAVSEYFANPSLALRKFRNKQGEFRRQDQYVFVLDKAQRKVVLNPAFSENNDVSVDDIADVQGQHFLRDMLENASPNSIQAIDYWWLSPETRQVEHRRAFYQQVGDQVIAVGTNVFPDSTP
ncbi:MAG: cache domain-containing protein [Paenalcaligenes sp.]